jgi:copper chaperone CopZ
MKNVFLLIAVSIAISANAQVTKVYLQASGLTCSMCSNAINKAIKSLDFVDKIDADVRHSTFEISFRENSTIDFDKIKRKVEGAGFFVSGFVAAINFNNLHLKENEPLKVGAASLYIINTPPQILNGIIKFRVLDRGFIPAKEFNDSKLSQSSAMEGVYHVSI